jgi:hypothetical protein
MFGVGDGCDDAELNDKCSCVMFMLEEVVILVKSERSEHCCDQILLWCS